MGGWGHRGGVGVGKDEDRGLGLWWRWRLGRVGIGAGGGMSELGEGGEGALGDREQKE